MSGIVPVDLRGFILGVFMSLAVLEVRKATGWRLAAGAAVIALLHLAGLVILFTSEDGIAPLAAAVLAWGCLNFQLLVLLRRPAIAAALSVTIIVFLSVLSQFKHKALMMTVTFLDVVIVDSDTVSFLLTIFPDLGWQLTQAAFVVLPLLALIWWVDPFRLRRPIALAGLVGCFALLAILSFAVPRDRDDEFNDQNYVSKFARSAAVAIVDLTTRQVLEADAKTADSLAPSAECPTPVKAPHIIFVLDESGFDATTLPGIKAPPEFKTHFRSFDGRQRSLVVEGAGGPTWYTEYNVLTGLSVRSYGRFAEGVTRLAAGRVERGLPLALRRCGYRTYSIYPESGAFLGARAFQTSAGIENFLDAQNLGARPRNPDGFYYDFAARTLSIERGRVPVFMLVYTTANHFPWNFRWRPDLTPDWRLTGNRLDVDEYLRRQAISVRDYELFVTKLRHEFPDDAFLIVRFGDHQPSFARYFIDPSLDPASVVQRIQNRDPRYFTAYYVIDTVNFTPIDLSSALDTLDAPYLPLMTLEAAGVPLDPSFAEQKKILQRCGGVFYLCSGGAEARRFNRLLIDANLIKGF
jgi:hypothetical protein